MREMGCDPYAVEQFVSTDSVRGLLEGFEEGKPVSLAGRVVSYRLMGKAGFAHLSDGEGRIQGYFRKDDLGETGWELFGLLDIGDHVGIEGELFVTKTGESSIHVKTLTPLSKALHALPLGKTKTELDAEGNEVTAQWYGLTDTEQRYRHRHLDLLCNPEARAMLLNRARLVQAVREFMNARGYLEVETPLLQLEAGGAAARPFVTHYNAYDLDVKLRISLELYLKRVLCGDVPKVYEIGRVFRNEGVSNRHNPEFTLLEFYEAFIQLEDVMEIVEGLFRDVCQKVFGSAIVRLPVEIDFSKPWRRANLLDLLEEHAGVRPEELGDLESAKRAMDRVGLPTEKEANLGGIVEKLLERFVEPTLIQPTFVVGYPIETSPLAKKDPARPGFTRRFEGYVMGREICNAFSEINDPLDQRERFEQQVRERAAGDDEAHPMDEEFLYALECGMPPAGGCGIGIDRLAMILTGAEVMREVILFPTMRPTSSSGEAESETE